MRVEIKFSIEIRTSLKRKESGKLIHITSINHFYFSWGLKHQVECTPEIHNTKNLTRELEKTQL